VGLRQMAGATLEGRDNEGERNSAKDECLSACVGVAAAGSVASRAWSARGSYSKAAYS